MGLGVQFWVLKIQISNVNFSQFLFCSLDLRDQPDARATFVKLVCHCKFETNLIEEKSLPSQEWFQSTINGHQLRIKDNFIKSRKIVVFQSNLNEKIIKIIITRETGK